MRPNLATLVGLLLLGCSCSDSSTSPPVIDANPPVVTNHAPPPAEEPDPILRLSEATAESTESAADRAFRLQMRQARTLAQEAVATGERGRMLDAVDAYLAAAALRPVDPVPLAEAGMLASEMGDAGIAIRMMERCRELDPESGPYQFLLGTYQHRLGDYDAAVIAFEKASEKDFRKIQAGDRLFQALWSQAIIKIEESQVHDALAILERAVALRPHHTQVHLAWYDIATAHRRLNQPLEAEKVLKDLIRSSPSYAPAYGELGALLVDSDRYDEAIDALRKSIQVDPGYAQGFVLLASTLTRKGGPKDLEEAERYFREYEERFPPTGAFLLDRGQYYLKVKKFDLALEKLRGALALDPSRIRAHYFLGLVWQGLGEDDKAQESMKRYEKAQEDERMMEEKHEEKEQRSNPKDEPVKRVEPGTEEKH
jgi:tetratricopeptide (TPR) repeat protein